MCRPPFGYDFLVAGAPSSVLYKMYLASMPDFTTSLSGCQCYFVGHCEISSLMHKDISSSFDFGFLVLKVSNTALRSECPA